MKKSELQKLIDVGPCSEGLLWAKKQPSMVAVWNNCERPDWLFWLLDKFAPLEKGMSVRLAVAFAERSLANFEKVFPDDKRPRLAIKAAVVYAENPSEDNRLAARSAAESAESAARSAAESGAVGGAVGGGVGAVGGGVGGVVGGVVGGGVGAVGGGVGGGKELAVRTDPGSR